MQFFFGEQNIERFLESKPNDTSPSVLLIDEANLQKPGMWDFLIPHISSTGGEIPILYKGKEYVLNNNFKIIFTCNPERYPGRDYHDILQDTPTVYVKAWTDETIKAAVLYPLCKNVLKQNLNQVEESALDMLLVAYHYAESLLPPDSLSIRDIQESTRRWLFLMKSGLNPKQAAYAAAISEWQQRFYKSDSREIFKTIVDAQFEIPDTNIPLERKLSTIHPLPTDFYLASEHKILFERLQEDLALFTAAKDEKTIDGVLSVKSGYLLEGPSGIGKSRLSRELLKSMDYKECKASELLDEKSTDRSKCFFQFTLSDDILNDTKILRAAFNQGCKVIIDELNLDPAIESLLNHLLTGKTPEGSLPDIRGFYVLASQNSVALEGRSVSPPALLNRLHVYYIEDYDKPQMINIAKQALAENPALPVATIVDAYVESKKRYPYSVNTRTFLEGVEKVKNDSRFFTNKDKPAIGEDEKKSLKTNR